MWFLIRHNLRSTPPPTKSLPKIYNLNLLSRGLHACSAVLCLTACTARSTPEGPRQPRVRQVCQHLCPTASSLFTSLCHNLVILIMLPIFSLCYYICYGALWPMISDFILGLAGDVQENEHFSKQYFKTKVHILVFLF